MKANYLLSNKFKIPGWILLILGVIAGALSDFDGAVDLLWQAVDEGMGYHDPWMAWDACFDPLRNDPGFQEWLRPKG